MSTILTNGSEMADDYAVSIIAESGDIDDAVESSVQVKQMIESTTLTLKLTDKTATSVKVTCTVAVLNGDTKKVLKTAKDLKKYTYKYELQTLNIDTTKKTTKDITVKSNSIVFTVDDLKPYNTYKITVIATETAKKRVVHSPGAIFSPVLNSPGTVSNIKVSLPDDIKSTSECTLSFSAPVSFCDEPTAVSTKGYRVCLVINGTIMGYSDSLITSGATKLSKKFKLNELYTKLTVKEHDIIQIGVQTWVKYKNNEVRFDSNFPKCSKTFISKQVAKEVFKVFLKTSTGFKPVLIYKI